MELIEIIFDVLTYGSVLLTIVILISYLLSKSNQKENPEFLVAEEVNALFLKKSLDNEQARIRKESVNRIPIIYSVKPEKNKELKIVRKPTVTSRETQENLRQNENSLIRSAKTNGVRYTIVNEEMAKKRKPHVVNFYL